MSQSYSEPTVTDAFGWLRKNVQGFAELEDNEVSAITGFSLLWSLFELKALQGNASVPAIHDWAMQVSSDETRRFSSCFEYFRSRYCSDGMVTAYFDGLGWRRRDKRPFVETVLRRTSSSSHDRVAALFIIILRLRNQFFHGSKWAHEFHGQRDNFRWANTALMHAIELTSGTPL